MNSRLMRLFLNSFMGWLHNCVPSSPTFCLNLALRQNLMSPRSTSRTCEVPCFSGQLGREKISKAGRRPVESKALRCLLGLVTVIIKPKGVGVSVVNVTCLLTSSVSKPIVLCLYHF